MEKINEIATQRKNSHGAVWNMLSIFFPMMMPTRIGIIIQTFSLRNNLNPGCHQAPLSHSFFFMCVSTLQTSHPIIRHKTTHVNTENFLISSNIITQKTQKLAVTATYASIHNTFYTIPNTFLAFSVVFSAISSIEISKTSTIF